jgi:hypothetical protein
VQRAGDAGVAVTGWRGWLAVAFLTPITGLLSFIAYRM